MNLYEPLTVSEDEVKQLRRPDYIKDAIKEAGITAIFVHVFFIVWILITLARWVKYQ